MRHIQDINEFFVKNIDVFNDLMFLQKNFSYYFNGVEAKINEDYLSVISSGEYIDIYFSLVMNNDRNRYDDCYDKRDCLEVFLNCSFKFNKNDKISYRKREFLEYAKEQDYIDCLVKMKDDLISEEIKLIKDYIFNTNKSIREHYRIASKYQKNIDALSEYYPVFLL
jgi:hypothetical protein